MEFIENYFTIFRGRVEGGKGGRGKDEGEREKGEGKKGKGEWERRNGKGGKGEMGKGDVFFAVSYTLVVTQFQSVKQCK